MTLAAAPDLTPEILVMVVLCLLCALAVGRAGLAAVRFYRGRPRHSGLPS